jgi:hypothetical protein
VSATGGRCVECDAVYEVSVSFMFEVFTAVGKLAAGGLGEELLGFGAE